MNAKGFFPAKRSTVNAVVENIEQCFALRPVGRGR